MMDRLSYRTIQSGLLLFWALWTGLVMMTNVLDALKQLGALPPTFLLVSGNFAFMSATTAAQKVPAVLNVVLYAGVILWEALTAWLLWQAFRAFRRDGNGASAAVERAFVVSLALWAAFLLVDEALIAYAVEATHMRILVAQMVTLLVVRGVGVAGRVEREAAGRHDVVAG